MKRRGFFSLLLAPLVALFVPKPKGEMYFLNPDRFYTEGMLHHAANLEVMMPQANAMIVDLTDDLCED